MTTPLGHQYASEPPPLLGWGSQTLHATTRPDELAVTMSHDSSLADGTEPAREAEPSRSRRAEPAKRWGRDETADLDRRRTRARTTAPPQAAAAPTANRADAPVTGRPRRPRITSHLERQLCRYLT